MNSIFSARFLCVPVNLILIVEGLRVDFYHSFSSFSSLFKLCVFEMFMSGSVVFVLALCKCPFHYTKFLITEINCIFNAKYISLFQWETTWLRFQKGSKTFQRSRLNFRCLAKKFDLVDDNLKYFIAVFNFNGTETALNSEFHEETPWAVGKEHQMFSNEFQRIALFVNWTDIKWICSYNWHWIDWTTGYKSYIYHREIDLKKNLVKNRHRPIFFNSR